MEKRITPIFLLVAAILMTYDDVTCLPSFMFEEGDDHVASAIVHHESPQGMRGRSEREAELLPSSLHFRFHLDNRPIRLRLKRHVRNGGQQFPVFTLKHGARVKRPMRDQEETGFYHDAQHGAAIMVTSNHGSQGNSFDLEGSMFIDGSEYLMAPTHRFVSSNTDTNNNNNNNNNDKNNNFNNFDNNNSNNNNKKNNNFNNENNNFNNNFDNNNNNNSSNIGRGILDNFFDNDDSDSPFQRSDPTNAHRMLHSFRRVRSHRMNYGRDWVDERDPFARTEARQREIERRLHRLSKGQGHDNNSSRRHNPFLPWTNGNARWKRQADDVTDTHFIEVSMIADFAIWERFLAYSEGDEDEAFKQIQQYYTLIAIMMDVRYQSVTRVDPTLKIEIHPVSLIVTDVKEEAVWTERQRIGKDYVNAISSLYALRKWVRNRVGVPEADHTMLFTGYDIVGDSRDTSTIGVAFIGTACTDNAVSLIEEYFTGTSGAVSAHELGHSLDAEHDGSYRQCNDNSANVMSTQANFPTDQRFVSNPWVFSPCSVDAFGAFLETSDCTRNDPNSDDVLPWGRSFDADEQCRLAKGPGSYFCRTVQSRRGFSSMCRRLYCYLPENPGYCGSVIAGEYTTCGDKKWCSKGRCVPSDYAPSVTDNCPQGDEPGGKCQGDLDCQDPKVRDVLCCRACKVDEKDTTSPPTLNDEKLLLTTSSSSSSSSSSLPLSTEGYADGTKSSETTTVSLSTTQSPLLSLPSLSSTTTTTATTAPPQQPSSSLSTTTTATPQPPPSSSSSPSPPPSLSSTITTTVTTATSASATTAESTDTSSPSPPPSSSITTTTATQEDIPTPMTATVAQPSPSIIHTTMMKERNTTKSVLDSTTPSTSSSSPPPPSSSFPSMSSSPSSSSVKSTASIVDEIQLTTSNSLISRLSSSPPQSSPPPSLSSSPPPPSSSLPSEPKTNLQVITQTPTSIPPTTTTTTTTTTTKPPSTPPPPPAPYIPCNSITCLCQRCFHCFYNVCFLFLPGGLYYNPNG